MRRTIYILASLMSAGWLPTSLSLAQSAQPGSTPGYTTPSAPFNSWSPNFRFPGRTSITPPPQPDRGAMVDNYAYSNYRSPSNANDRPAVAADTTSNIARWNPDVFRFRSAFEPGAASGPTYSALDFSGGRPALGAAANAAGGNGLGQGGLNGNVVGSVAAGSANPANAGLNNMAPGGSQGTPDVNGASMDQANMESGANNSLPFYNTNGITFNNVGPTYGTRVPSGQGGSRGYGYTVSSGARDTDRGLRWGESNRAGDRGLRWGDYSGPGTRSQSIRSNNTEQPGVAGAQSVWNTRYGNNIRKLNKDDRNRGR